MTESQAPPTTVFGGTIERGQFFREYFIQTRKEIDTEKHERDQLLNFLVLFLGAVVFGVSSKGNRYEFLMQPDAMALEVPALVIISALFWARHKKLRQISDRWFTLYHLAVREFGETDAAQMLESVVVKHLPGWRYIMKDLMLNLAFSLPVYGLLLLQCLVAHSQGDQQRLVLTGGVAVVHVVLSSVLLGRRCRDPYSRSHDGVFHWNKKAIREFLQGVRRRLTGARGRLFRS